MGWLQGRMGFSRAYQSLWVTAAPEQRAAWNRRTACPRQLTWQRDGPETLEACMTSKERMARIYGMPCRPMCVDRPLLFDRNICRLIVSTLTTRSRPCGGLAPRPSNHWLSNAFRVTHPCPADWQSLLAKVRTYGMNKPSAMSLHDLLEDQTSAAFADTRTHAPGPEGSLPITAEMLLSSH